MNEQQGQHWLLALASRCLRCSSTTIANLFVSLHKRKEILPKFLSNLYFYCLFIDNGFVTWKHDKDRATDKRNYKSFKKAVNSGGLRCTFTEPAPKVDFIDLTVNIVGSKVTINLYEKLLALHLYIPPNSCATLQTASEACWQGWSSASTASASSKGMWPIGSRSSTATCWTEVIRVTRSSPCSWKLSSPTQPSYLAATDTNSNSRGCQTTKTKDLLPPEVPSLWPTVHLVSHNTEVMERASPPTSRKTAPKLSETLQPGQNQGNQACRSL